MQHRQRRIAVIGSGVAGLVAAHTSRATAHVTLYEADSRLGGHADTHDVREGDLTLRIDTGFIVHNLRTYPVLTGIFDELGIATQESEMSMSVSDARSSREWAGARGLAGLFPTPARLVDLGHLRMLAEVPRFHRRARALLASTDADATCDTEQTLADFLAVGGFSQRFVRDYMEPLVAAVWSCDPLVATAYPAHYLFRFLEQHGMLSIGGSPTWRTVTGGSREYVRRIADGLDGIRLGSPVIEVREHDAGVAVRTEGGKVEEYDAVVIATHPAQALRLLADPTPAQQKVLGAITYSRNSATLHTDVSLLPRSQRAWSSWNFRRVREGAGPVVVTYDLTRLQRLDTEIRYLVTLGGEDLIDPATVVARMDYEHPIYTPDSVAAQQRLSEIGTDRIAFAGAYHGWGFHEDGARSGVEAARRLGLATERVRPQIGPQVTAPQIYGTTIRHLRRTPWRREFTHRSYLWVADIDALAPTESFADRRRAFWRGSIQARDHLSGDPQRSLRENLAHFLSLHGVELGQGRVLLAAQPRALGFCFNPISVFWCHREDGSPLATVVEVHNTYGDRHAYLLDPEHPEPVEKQMYVSPFHGSDGQYDVRAPTPTDRLHIAVRLRAPDGTAFSASLRGDRIGPVGATGLRRATAAAARAGLLNALRIRLHGIRLWARGLPIRPRPVHHQEGVR